MSITPDRRLLALVVLFLVSVILSTAVATADLTEDATRIFRSGDEDAENFTEYENTHGVDFSNIEPGSSKYYEHIAAVTDITFGTTAPSESFDGTTLLEYRKTRVRKITAAGGIDAPVIGQIPNPGVGKLQHVRIGIVGVYGGARPRIDPNSLPGETVLKPHVGRDGTLLLTSNYERHVDRYEDDRPENPDNRTIGWTYTRTNIEVDEDLTVSIGDKSIEKDSSPTALSYENIDSGETTIRVEYTVHLSYEETVEKWEWYNGSWEELEAEEDTDIESEEETAEATMQVYVTGGEHLRDIEQTVINVSEDSKRVILHFPSTSASGDMAHARGRLWSEIVFNRTVIRGPWRMYTKRNQNFAGDPKPLNQYLVAVRHRPRVASKTVSDEETGVFTRARLIAWEGSNLSSTTAAHSHVDVNTTEPQLYDRIVVGRVDGPATTIKTIHGKAISIDDDVQTVEYRTPEITIESLPGPGDRVRIRVTDPRSGDPVQGYNVRLFGTVQQNLTTKANGSVVADRQNMVVRADVVGDDLRGLTEQPNTDVLYSDVRETRVFMDEIDVMKRLYDLVFVLVAVSPLILLYFYIRHFQFFE